MHGTSVYVKFFDEIISSQELAKIIKGRKDYNKGPIRLLSCNVGNTENSENCFAQRLADTLGVSVKAPNNIVWVFSNGEITIGDSALSNNGKFIIFNPRKRG